MKTKVLELLKKYGFILALIIITTLAIVDGLRQRKLVQHAETEKQTLVESLRQVTTENERLQKTIDSTESKEQVVVETVVEKKDGTRVTRRKTENRQQTIVKQIETKETTQEVKTEQFKTQDIEKKVVTVTVTEPAKSNRLGLDLGLGSRIGLNLDFTVEAQVSYEMGYRLAPVIGVEFTPTLDAPKAIYAGIEVKL